MRRVTKRIGTLIPGVVVVVALFFYWQRPAPTAGREPRPGPVVEPVGKIIWTAPHLYLVPGGGCNTVVFVTSQGVVIVDTKYHASYEGLLSEIRTVTDKPITHIINTHRHPDHTQANPRLAQTAKSVVQANNVANFRQRWPDMAAFIEFNDRLTLLDGEDAIDLYHFGPAHTDGDTFVVFRAARVMDAGDVMPAKRLSTIVLEAGGNGATFPDVIEHAGATIQGVDHVITGHGPVVSWNEFVDHGVLMRAMVDYVQSSMQFGSNKDQVFKSFRAPDKFHDYDFSHLYERLDEIDRSLRPKWQRVWPWTAGLLPGRRPVA